MEKRQQRQAQCPVPGSGAQEPMKVSQPDPIGGARLPGSERDKCCMSYAACKDGFDGAARIQARGGSLNKVPKTLADTLRVSCELISSTNFVQDKYRRSDQCTELGVGAHEQVSVLGTEHLVGKTTEPAKKIARHHQVARGETHLGAREHRVSKARKCQNVRYDIGDARPVAIGAGPNIVCRKEGQWSNLGLDNKVDKDGCRAGHPAIVTIKERDVTAGTSCDSSVASCAWAGILLLDDLRLGQRNIGDCSASGGRGAICRAIIDHDQLYPRRRTRQRSDRVTDLVGAVISRDDDGEDRA